jgi:hypothetical protein
MNVGDAVTGDFSDAGLSEADPRTTEYDPFRFVCVDRRGGTVAESQ